MKKILIVAALALSFNATGQEGIKMLCDNGKYLDTMRNAVTEHVTSPDLSKSGLHGNYDIELTVLNDSATTSVVCILEGRIGTGSWTRIHLTPGVDGIICDSLTFTGAKTFVYRVAPGKTKIYGAWLGNYQSNAGRRRQVRLTLIHAAGGRSSYSARMLTSE